MTSPLRRWAGAVLAGLVASSLVLLAPVPSADASQGSFVALASPARALDTRPTGATDDGASQRGGVVTPATPVTLPLGGRFGIPNDAEAVVANLTVASPRADGWATVWPCGTPRPATSNINFVAGSTIANGITVGLGTGAAICLYADSPTDLIVDVSGYFPAGGAFDPLSPPLRMVDSRTTGSTDDGRFAAFGPLAPFTEQPLSFTGRVSALNGASALVVNVTATNATEDGWATAWPCGGAQPTTSTINFAAGRTIANSAMVRLSSDGRLCLLSSVRADFIVDVMGVVTTGTAGFAGLPVPARFLDTRSDGNTDDQRFQRGGLVGRTSVVEVEIAGRLGVPGNATAAILNLTVTGTRGDGWATVYPCGSTRPATSSINFASGATVANGVVARLGSGGAVCVYVDTSTHVIVDVAGVIQGATTGSTGTTVTPTPVSPTGQSFTVTSVADGDTFEVSSAAGTQRVRIIGINTAETGECWAAEAKAALSSLILGRVVTLTRDVSDTDQFGRLLRYVATTSTTDVGLSLVSNGHASAYRFEPDTARAATYSAAESSAKATGRGRWSGCTSSSTAQISIGLNYNPPGNENNAPNTEWVSFTNVGSAPVDLTNWTVADTSATHRYKVPAFVLPAGATVTLYTGSGVNTATSLYWGSGSAIWNNDGDTVSLYDAAGRLVVARSYT